MTKYLILSLIVVGCAHGPSLKDRYDQRFAALEGDYKSKVIAPMCPEDKDGPLAGLGSRPISTETCGLISELEFIEKPKFDQQCKSKGLSKAKCRNSFIERMSAKFLLRYPYADITRITLVCQAEGWETCDYSVKQSAVLFELKLLSSHNDAVLKAAQTKKEIIQAEYDADSAAEEVERRQRVGAALQSFGDSMQRSAQQNTSCESVPNGLGGFRTTCH